MLPSCQIRSWHMHPMHHQTRTVAVYSGALVDFVPTQPPRVGLHDRNRKGMQRACHVYVDLLLGLLLGEAHYGVGSLLGDAFN